MARNIIFHGIYFIDINKYIMDIFISMMFCAFIKVSVHAQLHEYLHITVHVIHIAMNIYTICSSSCINMAIFTTWNETL